MPAPDSPRIAFVGAGRVARALSTAFERAGLSAVTVPSRDVAAAQAAIETNELVFLSVTDSAIADVCSALRWPERTVALHCSGAHGLDVLAGASKRASFHPMQSFPHASLPHALGAGITISIEAEEELAPLLCDLARRINGRPLRLPPGTRALYHASGYFASPLLVTMLYQATTIWDTMGFDEKTALATLLPLLRETVRMVEEHGLENSLTGLVVRNDAGTLARHLKHLRRTAPEAAKHYTYLTRVSVDMAQATRRITPAQADELRSILD